MLKAMPDLQTCRFMVMAMIPGKAITNGSFLWFCGNLERYRATKTDAI